MRRASYALISAALALALLSGFIVARQKRTKDTRLMFTGDILLARQVAVERARTHGSPWDSIASVLKQADWVGGNLEGAIGPDSSCISTHSELCFAFPDDAPALLRDAGFKTLTVENNHAGDLGADGRASTLRLLADAELNAIDFDRSPRFVRIGDLSVSIVAISTIPAADGRRQFIPSIEVAQRLRLARALSNIVIVSVHWGSELQDWSSADQRTAAEWLVDHGADVIVGHHPHVVQKPDCVHGHPVFFSLGNHVFDQKYPETKEGLIADCRVRGRKLTCGGIRTHARRGSAVPVVSGTLSDPTLDGCSVPIRPTMTISGIELRATPWSASNDDSAGVALEGWRNGVRRWTTRRVELVSLETRLHSVDDEQLLFALERHPSAFDHEVALRPRVYAVTERGLVAKWRGTSLAWPLVDAIIDSSGGVCALHRGDSFVRPDPSTTARRTMRYRWNGFGFNGVRDENDECARAIVNVPSGAVGGGPISFARPHSRVADPRSLRSRGP